MGVSGGERSELQKLTAWMGAENCDAYREYIVRLRLKLKKCLARFAIDTGIRGLLNWAVSCRHSIINDPKGTLDASCQAHSLGQ